MAILIASPHRLFMVDGLALDFSDKRNFSIERVVVPGRFLYHSCQGLHKVRL